MKVSQKIFSTILCAVVSLFSSSVSANVTIQVASWADSKGISIQREMVEEFMKLYPHINIVLESIPRSFKEKIMTTMAAGSPPDVFLLDSVILPTFINRGLLEDLRPYVEKYGIDLSIYFQNVLKIAEANGALYAFPTGFTPYVMYYNKSLFDEANLPYPQEGWTWEDYLYLSKLLTKDTDGDGKIDQFGTTFNNWLPGWISWVWSNGGDILSPSGVTADGYFNSPKTVEAIQFLIDLRTKYRVAPHGRSLVGVGGGGTSSLFYTNRIGMSPGGHWRLVQLRKYIDTGELKIGVAPLPTPKGGNHSTVMYQAGWCVPKGGKNIPEAVLVAAFLSGEMASRIDARKGTAIPAIRSLAEEISLKDTLGLEAIFLNEVQYCRQPWGTKVEEFSRVEKIAQDAVDKALIGGQNLQEVLAQAVFDIDKTIHKYAANSEKWSQTDSGREVVRLLQALMIILMIAGILIILVIKADERKELIAGLSFLSPSAIHLMIFVITPLLFSFYLSFHQWNIILPIKPFVGLENFKQMFSDRDFLNALKNTAIYSLHVPIGMTISLLIAVLLNQKIPGVNIFRTLFFLPSISSFVAVALVWAWIYDPQFGLANYILSFFDIKPLGWLTEPATALISIMIMSIWLGIGYQMVIFLAGLQSIPSHLYEAAEIDGAGWWVKFSRITLPLLTPTSFFVLVTSMIGSFQVFASIYVMTRGGPIRSTDVAVYHIYQSAWEYLDVGYASAMSWVLFIIIVSITAIQFKLIPREVEFE